MRIDALDPASVDAPTAEELARLRNAAISVDAPHLAPVSGGHVRLRLRHGWDGRPIPHLFVARNDAGDMVGYAEVELPVWDNHHMAFADLETHPDARGGAVGDALLDRVVSTVVSAGRTWLVGGAWQGSHRDKFWRRHAYTVASRAAQRRLVVSALDWQELDRLHGTSLAASSQYDIEVLPEPAPAELVPALLELHAAMNDSPLDDLQLEDDVWTEERLRGYERSMSERGIRLHRLLARRRDDGTLGGHTVVAVEDERPQLGFQEDTAVVRGHRGNRLGLRLKIEMLRWLAMSEPQIERIDTWNADSNTHMLAVNDALGCKVVGHSVEMQKRLTAPQAQSWPSSRSSASSSVPS